MAPRQEDQRIATFPSIAEGFMSWSVNGGNKAKEKQRVGSMGFESLPHLPGGAVCLLVFPLIASLYFSLMSIRKAGGEWEPMTLPVQARLCRVCREDLYRDKTILRGGWSRCTVCDEFVHYSCLASGKVSFLKARPRVCKICRSVQEGRVASSLKRDGPPVAAAS